VPKRELYERTGIQFMQINSLYQLLAMRLRNDPALAQARRLVFMADLVAHALCGEVFSEYTLGSTSQMMDMRTGEWSQELLSRLDLPMDILPRVVKPGTVVGKLTSEAALECGCRRVPVIAGASHDTAAAVAGAPQRVVRRRSPQAVRLNSPQAMTGPIFRAGRGRLWASSWKNPSSRTPASRTASPMRAEWRGRSVS